MENVATITIHGQEIKKEKQTFIAFSAEINGVWYKIKFVKECENAPKIKGLYELTINFDDCSVQKGRRFVKNDGTEGVDKDTIWVKNIVEIRRHSEEELREANRLVMNTIFGR